MKPAQMIKRRLLTICLLITILLLIILIKNNKFTLKVQRDNSVNINEIFNIKKDFYEKRKEQNEVTLKQTKLIEEGEGKKGGYFMKCPYSFNIKDSKEVTWFKSTFKHLSPYSEWKRMNNFVYEPEQTLTVIKTKNVENIYNTNIIKINDTSDVSNQKNLINRNNSIGTLSNSQPYNTPYNKQDRIAIITPISNAKRTVENYFQTICSFTYPHHLISIFLGEDSSNDGTLYEAKAYEEKLRGCFNQIKVVQLIGKQQYLWPHLKHSQNYQFHRRKHLSMARNQLLMKGVADNDWVLWIDVDVKHAPVDMIEHLLSSNKEIVTVNCLYRKTNSLTDVYDRNTWAETDKSKKDLESKNDIYLMLEGYEPSKRKYLNDLKYVEEEKESEEVIDDGYSGDDEGNSDGDGVGKNVNKNENDTEKYKLGNANTNLNSRFKINSTKYIDEKDLSYENTTGSNIEIKNKNDSKKTEIENKFKAFRIRRDRYLKAKTLKKKKKMLTPNLLVKLDGVGCCVLLVKADLHRKGLNFPPYIYDHHIESEGLAKMASSIYNTTSYGLPHVYVVHW